MSKFWEVSDTDSDSEDDGPPPTPPPAPPARDHTQELPDELLAQVFLWVLRGTARASALTGVCRRWRAVLSAHANWLTPQCEWRWFHCSPGQVFVDAHALVFEAVVFDKRPGAVTVVAPPRSWRMMLPSRVGARRVKTTEMLGMHRGVIYFNAKLRGDPVPVVVKVDASSRRVVGVVEPVTPCTFVKHGVVHTAEGPVDDDGLPFEDGGAAAVAQSCCEMEAIHNWEPPFCVKYDSDVIWTRGAAPI